MVCVDEMDTAYLDNLDEYINDEGRIVTYKWLSLTLGVHSNVAKQMLHHFVMQQRGGGGGDDGGGGLTVTYLLTGAAEESDGAVRKVVKVVREVEIEAARAAMNTVSSQHVYSVQKSALPDIGLLYGTDYDVTKQHITSTSRYSAISCSEAQVSRSTGRIQHLVKDEAPTPLHKSVPKTNEKKEEKKYDTKLDCTTTTTISSTTTATTTTGTTTTGTTTAAVKATSQIASMFAKQTKKLESCPSTAAKEEKAPAKAKGAGISAFFTKGPVQRRPDTTKLGNTTSSPKSDSTPCPDESKGSLPSEDAQLKSKGKEDSLVFGVEQEDKEEVKSEGAGAGTTKTTKTKTTSSSSASKKRKSKGKKKDDPKTKRTRIMQLSDSESEEEEEEERNEEEDERLLLLPSPPPPIAVNSDSEEENEGEKSLQPSKCPEEEAKVGMRKKIVDETFMDDKGYFVTKKVMKLVPLTEEEIKQEEQEEEERKKKEEERRIKEEEEKKKKSSPTVKSETSPSSSSGQKKRKKGGKEDNKKQANITSFFTKK